MTFSRTFWGLDGCYPSLSVFFGISAYKKAIIATNYAPRTTNHTPQTNPRPPSTVHRPQICIFALPLLRNIFKGDSFRKLQSLYGSVQTEEKEEEE